MGTGEGALVGCDDDGTKIRGRWLSRRRIVAHRPKEEPLRIAMIFIIGALIGTTLGFVVYDTVGPAMVSPEDFATQTPAPTPHDAAR
jgi:hypothetical protein